MKKLKHVKRFIRETQGVVEPTIITEAIDFGDTVMAAVSGIEHGCRIMVYCQFAKCGDAVQWHTVFVDLFREFADNWSQVYGSNTAAESDKIFQKLIKHFGADYPQNSAFTVFLGAE